MSDDYVDVMFTISGSVRFAADEFAALRRDAADCKASVERYLMSESSIWWDDLLVQTIDVDVL